MIIEEVSPFSCQRPFNLLRSAQIYLIHSPPSIFTLGEVKFGPRLTSYIIISYQFKIVFAHSVALNSYM